MSKTLILVIVSTVLFFPLRVVGQGHESVPDSTRNKLFHKLVDLMRFPAEATVADAQRVFAVETEYESAFNFYSGEGSKIISHLESNDRKSLTIQIARACPCLKKIGSIRSFELKSKSDHSTVTTGCGGEYTVEYISVPKPGIQDVRCGECSLSEMISEEKSK
jgi:hypothetical protein